MVSLLKSRPIDQKILIPLNYLYKVFGKDFEVHCTHGFNHWLKTPKEKFETILDVAKVLRDSTLLVDDIEDGGLIRKGIPTAHTVYGLSQTLNAANFGYFIAMERALSLNHPKSAELFSDRLIDIHRGQGMELYWTDNCKCPSEDEYKAMCIFKSSSVIKLCVSLMQLFSDCKEDFTPLLETLGLYFQIRDDYCGFVLKEQADSKGFCADITEGKFNFPVRHAVECDADDEQLLNILRKKTDDLEMKRHVVNLLDKAGSLAYTRQVLFDLDKQARVYIERFGGNPYLTSRLDKMLNWKEGVTNL